MLKNISNLGKSLSKNEQKSIKGGLLAPPEEELCVNAIITYTFGVPSGWRSCDSNSDSNCCEN